MSICTHGVWLRGLWFIVTMVCSVAQLVPDLTPDSPALRPGLLLVKNGVWKLRVGTGCCWALPASRTHTRMYTHVHPHPSTGTSIPVYICREPPADTCTSCCNLIPRDPFQALAFSYFYLLPRKKPGTCSTQYIHWFIKLICLSLEIKKCFQNCYLIPRWKIYRVQCSFVIIFSLFFWKVGSTKYTQWNVQILSTLGAFR